MAHPLNVALSVINFNDLRKADCCMHSFDPCIACAIQVTDPKGEELVQVKVN